MLYFRGVQSGLHLAVREELTVIAVEAWTGWHALVLRKAMRLSQREFAAMLGISLATVTKWEAKLGATTLRPISQQILDTALARSSEEVKKRFIELSEGMAAEARAASSYALTDGQQSADPLPITGSEGADGLSEIYDRILVDYAALDNAAGPQSAISMITRHADLLADSAEEDSGPMRRVLLRTAARYAEFAGWLHQDSGDMVCAVSWTERALSLAHAAGEAGLVAYTLMRRSNQAVEQGKSTLALGLAEAALDSAGASTARIRALGLRQRAASLALSRDPARALDAVAEARDCIASDPEWSPLTGYCTLPYLDAEAAVCQILLGNAEAAVDLLAPAISSWPDGYPRDRAYYQAHLAVAMIGTGMLDEGLAEARESARAVRHIGSWRTVEQLDKAASALAHRGDKDASDALLGDLAAIAARPGSAGDTLTA